MKLYYSKGACSLAVRIALHELGIPCEFEAVDLKTKKTEKGADFFKVNPKGAVPTLVLDTQEVLTENAVIQQYLADKQKAFEVLPPVNDMKRYHALEWLNFVSTELHKGCSPFYNPNVSEEARDKAFRPLLKNKLKVVEERLNKNKFLTGDQFTLADGYLFVVLCWLPSIKIELSEFPHLTRFFAETKKRKAVEQALKEEGLGG